MRGTPTLAGSQAFKLKEPQGHADMDYRTLARHRQACREEPRPTEMTALQAILRQRQPN